MPARTPAKPPARRRRANRRSAPRESGGTCCSLGCCCWPSNRCWRIGLRYECESGGSLDPALKGRHMHAELIRIIQDVRRRWRFKLALRGAVGVLGIGQVVLLAGASGLEVARFSPGAIIAFRIVVFAAVVGLAGWLLARPLMRRVSDDQVALYL